MNVKMDLSGFLIPAESNDFFPRQNERLGLYTKASRKIGIARANLFSIRWRCSAACEEPCVSFIWIYPCIEHSRQYSHHLWGCHRGSAFELVACQFCELCLQF